MPRLDGELVPGDFGAVASTDTVCWIPNFGSFRNQLQVDTVSTKL